MRDPVGATAIERLDAIAIDGSGAASGNQIVKTCKPTAAQCRRLGNAELIVRRQLVRGRQGASPWLVRAQPGAYAGPTDRARRVDKRTDPEMRLIWTNRNPRRGHFRGDGRQFQRQVIARFDDSDTVPHSRLKRSRGRRRRGSEQTLVS